MECASCRGSLCMTASGGRRQRLPSRPRGRRGVIPSPLPHPPLSPPTDHSGADKALQAGCSSRLHTNGDAGGVLHVSAAAVAADTSDIGALLRDSLQQRSHVETVTPMFQAPPLPMEPAPAPKSAPAPTPAPPPAFTTTGKGAADAGLPIPQDNVPTPAPAPPSSFQMPEPSPPPLQAPPAGKRWRASYDARA